MLCQRLWRVYELGEFYGATAAETSGDQLARRAIDILLYVYEASECCACAVGSQLIILSWTWIRRQKRLQNGRKMFLIGGLFAKWSAESSSGVTFVPSPDYIRAMKSFTDHPHNTAAADGTEVGAILSSSDDGAISSGSSIAPTEGVDGSIVDGEAINGTPQSATAGVESPPGLQRKGLRVSFPEFEVVSGYMDPPRPWNDGRCSSTAII